MTDAEITFLPVGQDNERFGSNLLDNKKLTRLYCMNGGHHLQILPDGTVEGKRDENDVHSKNRNTIIFQWILFNK